MSKRTLPRTTRSPASIACASRWSRGRTGWYVASSPGASPLPYVTLRTRCTAATPICERRVRLFVRDLRVVRRDGGVVVRCKEAMPIQLPAMDPCYFCQIRDGAIDRWNVIEQTGLTFTVLNGRQFEIGQCMIVPTRHAPTLLDLTPEEDAAIMAAARRVAQAMVA